MHEWLGWLATAVFTASYGCRDARTLRYVQMAGALLWMLYGLAAGARPVVVANLLLLAAAAAAARAHRPSRADQPAGRAISG